MERQEKNKTKRIEEEGNNGEKSLYVVLEKKKRMFLSIQHNLHVVSTKTIITNMSFSIPV